MGNQDSRPTREEEPSDRADRDRDLAALRRNEQEFMATGYGLDTETEDYLGLINTQYTYLREAQRLGVPSQLPTMVYNIDGIVGAVSAQYGYPYMVENMQSRQLFTEGHDAELFYMGLLSDKAVEQDDGTYLVPSVAWVDPDKFDVFHSTELLNLEHNTRQQVAEVQSQQDLQSTEVENLRLAENALRDSYGTFDLTKESDFYAMLNAHLNMTQHAAKLNVPSNLPYLYYRQGPLNVGFVDQKAWETPYTPENMRLRSLPLATDPLETFLGIQKGLTGDSRMYEPADVLFLDQEQHTSFQHKNLDSIEAGYRYQGLREWASAHPEEQAVIDAKYEEDAADARKTYLTSKQKYSNYYAKRDPVMSQQLEDFQLASDWNRQQAKAKARMFEDYDRALEQAMEDEPDVPEIALQRRLGSFLDRQGDQPGFLMNRATVPKFLLNPEDPKSELVFTYPLAIGLPQYSEYEAPEKVKNALKPVFTDYQDRHTLCKHCSVELEFDSRYDQLVPNHVNEERKYDEVGMQGYIVCMFVDMCAARAQLQQQRYAQTLARFDMSVEEAMATPANLNPITQAETRSFLDSLNQQRSAPPQSDRLVWEEVSRNLQANIRNRTRAKERNTQQHLTLATSYQAQNVRVKNPLGYRQLVTKRNLQQTYHSANLTMPRKDLKALAVKVFLTRFLQYSKAYYFEAWEPVFEKKKLLTQKISLEAVAKLLEKLGSVYGDYFLNPECRDTRRCFMAPRHVGILTDQYTPQSIEMENKPFLCTLCEMCGWDILLYKSACYSPETFVSNEENRRRFLEPSLLVPYTVCQDMLSCAVRAERAYRKSGDNFGQVQVLEFLRVDQSSPLAQALQKGASQEVLAKLEENDRIASEHSRANTPPVFVRTRNLTLTSTNVTTTTTTPE